MKYPIVLAIVCVKASRCGKAILARKSSKSTLKNQKLLATTNKYITLTTLTTINSERKEGCVCVCKCSCTQTHTHKKNFWTAASKRSRHIGVAVVKVLAVRLSSPVLRVVAGLLRGQRARQPGHLDPDGVVQVLLTGVDGAGHYERHAKQTGPVLLGRQEVELRPHLARQTSKVKNDSCDQREAQHHMVRMQWVLFFFFCTACLGEIQLRCDEAVVEHHCF